MRVSVISTVAASIFALLSTIGGTQAATSPEEIADVLGSCPTEARVGTCGNAVIDFANALPATEERNADLLALVGALAQEAAGGQLSPIVCQEIEVSIRLAGQAAYGTNVREEITAVADGLCVGDVDLTTTGGVGRNGGANSGGNTAPGGNTPGGNQSGGTNGGGTTGGGNPGGNNGNPNGGADPWTPPDSIIDPQPGTTPPAPPVTPPAPPVEEEPVD